LSSAAAECQNRHSANERCTTELWNYGRVVPIALWSQQKNPWARSKISTHQGNKMHVIQSGQAITPQEETQGWLRCKYIPASDNHHLSELGPTHSAIHSQLCQLIGEAADLIVIPIMVFVHGITVLVHLIVVIFQLVIVIVPAMPTLEAIPFLRFRACPAWFASGHASAARLLSREIRLRCRRR